MYQSLWTILKKNLSFVTTGNSLLTLKLWILNEIEGFTDINFMD